MNKKIVGLLAGGGVAAAAALLTLTSRRPPPPAYQEVAVKRGDLRASILATGTVQPENRLEIKPPIAGRVERVLVKEGQVVRKGQVLVWMSSTERAALLDAARSRGPEELRRWEEMYRSTPVMAPIAGTVISRNVEAGQSFSSTEAILVMSDRLTVKAQVDETDIAQIRLGQAAEIVLDAYAGGRIPARVDQIAFEAKTVNNVTTYVVDVLPDPPARGEAENTARMRAGMTANVSFVTEARAGALLVPAAAIKGGEAGARATVLIKAPGDGTPREQAIEAGLSDGRQTEIISGLQEGDVVLVAQLPTGGAKARAASPFGLPSGPKGRGRP